MKAIITQDPYWGPVRYKVEVYDGPDGIDYYYGIVDNLEDTVPLINHFVKVNSLHYTND